MNFKELNSVVNTSRNDFFFTSLGTKYFSSVFYADVKLRRDTEGVFFLKQTFWHSTQK